MPKYILDSSIVIKWISDENEKNVEDAFNVYRAFRKGQIELVAPGFILIEILNICFKKKHLAIDKIKKAIKFIEKSGIRFLNLDDEATNDLVKIMFEFSTTSYDSLYLLLAKQEKCKLLTADEELLKIRNLTISLDQLKI